VVDIPEAVTDTNFGDHRLRGFWVSGDQISPSPIDFHRRPTVRVCDNVSRWLPLKMRTRPLRMRRITMQLLLGFDDD